MNLLTVDHITKVYTQRELFHDASFYLQDGEKVGIIGINGTGKSTLLKIMAGLEEPDAGNVVRANHLVIRYLPQMPEFDPQKGALENVLSYAQIGSVHQQEDRAARRDAIKPRDQGGPEQGQRRDQMDKRDKEPADRLRHATRLAARDGAASL